MIDCAPRLLSPPDEVAARRELMRLGIDPSEAAEAAAGLDRRMVRLDAVPWRVAVRLREELRGFGGEALFAVGASGAVILVASTLQLRLLCGRLEGAGNGLGETASHIAALLHRLEQSPRRLVGRSCTISLDRPRIMGVLNVTPNSFSDGGRFASIDSALRHAETMAEEGADLIDIGGETTRPGAPEIPVAMELDRVLPVLEALRREFDLPLSIDTTKSAVAASALAAGAEFINDISGFTFDPRMAAVVAAGGGGVFLMHTRGRPDRMQQETDYVDLLGEVIAHLRRGLAEAATAGIPEEKLAIDPGIGFGKDAEGNLELLRRLPELRSLGRPILLGTSRKSFIGRVIGQPEPQQRIFGTVATVALGVERGAHLFRVHDVRPAREAALMAWAIVQGGA